MFANMLELYEKQKNSITTKKIILDDTTLDSSDKSAIFGEQAIATESLNNFSEWLETEDDELDEGEGLGDRLLALVVGIADEDKNGELDDDENEVVNIALNSIYDYIVAKGVSEENATELLENFDNDLAENVRGLLLSSIPDGEDELVEDMDKVTFSKAENESVFDGVDGSIILDAAYRKVFAIRNGKKKRINKRISGVVRLSAKQKQALRKARKKAHTGVAKMRRLKSFKIRKRTIHK